jgi:TfdA family taurine catabolism dioxygenase TauD
MEADMTYNPKPIVEPCAWKGAQFDLEKRALWTLTAAELDEIACAVKLFASSVDTAITHVSPERFPLPTVGPRMVALQREVHKGSGVVLLRGLPSERFTADELAIAFAGLGSFVGEFLAQSYQGEVLGHIIDVTDVEEGARGYHMGGAQGFHTDTTPCDIVGLMCLRAAKSGGRSRIVSAAAIHNFLLEHRPNLLKVLYGDFLARRNEAEAGEDASPILKHVSVFAQIQGVFSCYLTAGELWRAVKAGDYAMSPLQVEALEEIQHIGASPEFYLDMDIGEGDIQFLNNRTIMHGRLPYEDYEEFTRRRYMLRLSFYVSEWEPRPNRQIHATLNDARQWLRRRHRGVDMPSAYLKALTQNLAKRGKSGTVLPRVKVSTESAGVHNR